MQTLLQWVSTHKHKQAILCQLAQSIKESFQACFIQQSRHRLTQNWSLELLFMVIFFRSQSQCWWQRAGSVLCYISMPFHLIVDHKDQYSGVILVRTEDNQQKLERYTIRQNCKSTAIQVSQHLQFSEQHKLHQKLQLLKLVSKRIVKVAFMWNAYTCKQHVNLQLFQDFKQAVCYMLFPLFSCHLSHAPKYTELTQYD